MAAYKPSHGSRGKQRTFWSDLEDAFLAENYQTMSIADIAKHLGRTQRAVASHRHRLASPVKVRPWTSEEVQILRDWYDSRDGKPMLLGELASRLGRMRSNVCRKARALGLTKTSRPTGRKDRRKFKTKEELFAHLSQTRKEWQRLNGHPRGMLGKCHTEAFKERMAKISSKYWASLSKSQVDEFVGRGLATRAANGPTARSRGSWKAGWREIGGQRCFFRSSWEANYARLLELLCCDWKHEPECFVFPVGSRCIYTPDFRVRQADGEFVYHEVKGWMDQRSLRKIQLMAEHYPEVKLLVVDAKQYRVLEKDFQYVISEWE